MAATTSAFPVSGQAGTQSAPIPNSTRRTINPQAGRALEILAHAIEYLTDEYVHETNQLSAHDPQIQAIQLLMAINRGIYLDCPVTPTLRGRLRAWLRMFK